MGTMLLEPAASLSGEDSSGMEDDNMDDAEGLENRQYNLVSERSPHTLEETYRLGEELGRGTFSVVCDASIPVVYMLSSVVNFSLLTDVLRRFAWRRRGMRRLCPSTVEMCDAQ